MIPVKENLVSASKYGTKCPYNMEPKYITVHNTYNDAPAENEVNYMIRNNNEVSFHFAIDDNEVIQGIPVDRNAWAAGDGNGPGNRSSIHVEICYSKSGGTKYYKAEGLAVQFIAQLLKERGWGVNRVKKHEDWSGKHCPHRILDEGRWQKFLDAIQAELNSKGAFKVAGRDINKVSDWAESAWKEAQQNGYFDGSRPGATLTREEAAVVINRLRRNFLKLIGENTADIKSLEARLQEIEQEE